VPSSAEVAPSSGSCTSERAVWRSRESKTRTTRLHAAHGMNRVSSIGVNRSAAAWVSVSLGVPSATPSRPRRQPATERCAPPDRDQQSRYHPGAHAYLERKRAEGKSRRESIRCLKRLLAPEQAPLRSRASRGEGLPSPWRAPKCAVARPRPLAGVPASRRSSGGASSSRRLETADAFSTSKSTTDRTRRRT
jgi:hypothetical protein